MSTRDRYTKIIESLVNGEEATASDLLHEAFVEKAREIWNDLVEADESIEEEVAEDELEEAIGGEEADDFIGDIEAEEEEIEAEEMFGEEDDEMSDDEAADELGGDEMDFDGDGEMDDHEEEHGEIEDKMQSVEDALTDLKAEFAKLMGDEAEEEAEPEMEEEYAFESDDADEEIEESADEEADDLEEASEESEEENLEEGAELKKVGKEGMHPADMPAGDDGKSSPVGPGLDDPFKGQGNNDADPVNFAGGAAEKGGSTPAAKDMNVTHPGDGAKMSPESRGHGAEKKGKAE
jgi:hypothetical protein